jgi:phosphohistidine phosphatase
MILALVRHTLAEDREAFALEKKPDRLRPITARGRKRMRRNAVGIKVLLPQVDLLASSPLTRAVQTAEILLEAYRMKKAMAKIAELEPGHSPVQFIHWLAKQKMKNVVMAVGHEPHLSQLLSYCLVGAPHAFVLFKKGGLCILEFAGKIDKGRAKMLCLIPPAQLRKMK